MPIPQDVDMPSPRDEQVSPGGAPNEGCKRSPDSVKFEGQQASPSHAAVQANGSDMESSNTPATNSQEAFCSDRAELIERLKRGESPTWVPNQSVSSLSVVCKSLLL